MPIHRGWCRKRDVAQKRYSLKHAVVQTALRDQVDHLAEPVDPGMRITDDAEEHDQRVELPCPAEGRGEHAHQHPDGPSR